MTITLRVTLTERQCPTCWIWYAVDDAVLSGHDVRGTSWYCPNGHGVHFTKSKLQQAQERADKAERAAAREAQRAANLADDLRLETITHAATKGQLTKLKNRVGNGVCPCCNRTFVNLQRHMGTQHPGYAASE